MGERERDFDRQRAQKESQQLIDGMNDTVWVLDFDGQIETVNDAAVQALGHSREELLSKKIHELDAGLDPGEITELIEQMPVDEIQVFQTSHETKDGGLIPVEVSSSLVPFQGETRILSVARDITKRKRYERQLESQRDNLEVLNQVVRHDINNHMTVIRGRADMLENHVEEGGREDLKAVQDATEKAIELTRTARDLSATMLNSENDVRPVRLDRQLEGPISNTRRQFKDAVIAVETIPDIRVHGNDLLESVFRNLIHNAVVHNDKPVPEVKISTTVDDETVTVAVADNGPGIPDNQKDEIFGRGEKGLDSPGTGIGLYLVQTLVHQYGGDVWVEDNEPAGSVFVIEFVRSS